MSPREADAPAPEDNDAMELPPETERLVVSAKRMFSGRDGRIGLTLVLAATAALEASIYTPERPEYHMRYGTARSAGS